MQTKQVQGKLWKRDSIARVILAALLATGIFFSCKKDENTATPAYQIMQSEKLTIPASIELPTNLPKGNARVATYYAEGVQKYKAQAKAGAPTEFEWVFVAPDAKLYDISNTLVGTHGAGPHWRLSPADSIFAKAYAPAKTAPSPNGSAIDWLLLEARADKPRTGIFIDVAYVQRIATTGGKAPAAAPTSISETKEVPYTAIYRFTKIKP